MITHNHWGSCSAGRFGGNAAGRRFAAITDPGVTYPCRKVKIRRDGAWLRIGLPSGRALCYPNPGIDKDGNVLGHFKATGIRPKFAHRLSTCGIEIKDEYFDPTHSYE